MSFLPISINIGDASVLVIGGGKLALSKIQTLEQFTNRITVIAPKVMNEIHHRPYVTVIERPYEPDDLASHLLVFAATADPTVNRKVKEDAENYKCLVNIVDQPVSGDFISSAIYKKDNVTVAINSNGKDVLSSIRWRNRIKKLDGEGLLPETAVRKEPRWDEFY